MVLAVLDMVGVLLFGVVGVLASSIAVGAENPAAVTVLGELGLGGLTLAQQTIAVATVSLLFFVGRSIVSLLIIRRVGLFLARNAAEISSDLLRRLLARPLTDVQRRTSQEVGFATTQSVDSAVSDVLNNTMVIRTELALLTLLGLMLLFLDPVTTLLAFSFFGLVFFCLKRLLSGWSERAGERHAQGQVAGLRAVQDSLAAYREIYTSNVSPYFIDRYLKARHAAARAIADNNFISQVPRFSLEIAMLCGIGLLVATLSWIRGFDAALGAMALFLAAGLRVAPSLLRLNGARLTLRSLAPRCQYAFDLRSMLDDAAASTGPASASSDVVVLPVEASWALGDGRQGQADSNKGVSVRVSDLTVRYPNSREAALVDVTLQIAGGQRVALVGPSGAGKTTLVDTILGVLQPSSGQVELSGMSPQDLVATVPGTLGYVPQQVSLVEGSVASNVALGRPADSIELERVWWALQQAQLADLIRSMDARLDSVLGEGGVQLSGGQRQRLGLARALYGDPQLIVLDEATSALDVETEHAMSRALDELPKGVTRITVAHRLATVQNADWVFYFDQAQLRAQGSFQDLQSRHPGFARQVRLSGLGFDHAR